MRVDPLESMLGVVTRGYRVALGSFDGGQVADDNGALLVGGGRRGSERGGQRLLGLGDMPGLESGTVMARGPSWVTARSGHEAAP